MTVRWTVRAANDQAPQCASRALFEAPKKDNSPFGELFFFYSFYARTCTLCHCVYGRPVAAVNWNEPDRLLRRTEGRRVCAAVKSCRRSKTVSNFWAPQDSVTGDTATQNLIF